jgi:protein FAM50
LSFNFEAEADEDDEAGDDQEADEPQKDEEEFQIKRKQAPNESGVPDQTTAADDNDHLDEHKNAKKARITKNPEVDTTFLPDRDREEEEKRLREQLRQEWVEKQETLKNEDIEITFSYWDGSGHRRSVKMKKGSSIYQFMTKGLDLLRKEFHELRTINADQLMYVKEDLIIPHHYTFYDFIVTKARGKSGPLFSFDVHDDIRLVADATVEKNESHAGKVLMRSWYERNKHIFPASRWEPYDPTKNYEKYTISDKKN